MNDLPISPIQIIFDSDDSYISDDSDIIVISDEFEEENKDPRDDVVDDEEAGHVDRSPPSPSPPTP